jgi:hypothetical protein
MLVPRSLPEDCLDSGRGGADVCGAGLGTLTERPGRTGVTGDMDSAAGCDCCDSSGTDASRRSSSTPMLSARRDDRCVGAQQPIASVRR